MEHLPPGYVEVDRLDMQKDKKIALLVNGLALLLAVIMAVPGIILVPIAGTFSQFNLPLYLTKLGVAVVGLVVYIILHEAVHGIFMRRFSSIKPKFGFTGLYAFAGSQAYFNRRQYITIALAPVIVWGFVLTLLNFFVPADWFWVVYFIQIMNVSGAGGDFYVTWRVMHMRPSVLTQDSGVDMVFFDLAQDIPTDIPADTQG